MAARTAAAPPALRGRVLQWLEASDAAAGDPATRLAAAAQQALAAVLSREGDRSVALDLLAADALLTLALLHRAEQRPEALEELAQRLSRGPVTP